MLLFRTVLDRSWCQSTGRFGVLQMRIKYWYTSLYWKWARVNSQLCVSIISSILLGDMFYHQPFRKACYYHYVERSHSLWQISHYPLAKFTGHNWVASSFAWVHPANLTTSLLAIDTQTIPLPFITTSIFQCVRNSAHLSRSHPPHPVTP